MATSPSASSPSSSSNHRLEAIVIQEQAAGLSGELQCNEGDRIRLIWCSASSGWWLAQPSPNGGTPGWVPASALQIIDDGRRGMPPNEFPVEISQLLLSSPAAAGGPGSFAAAAGGNKSRNHKRSSMSSPVAEMMKSLEVVLTDTAEKEKKDEENMARNASFVSNGSGKSSSKRKKKTGRSKGKSGDFDFEYASPSAQLAQQKESIGKKRKSAMEKSPLPSPAPPALMAMFSKPSLEELQVKSPREADENNDDAEQSLKYNRTAKSMRKKKAAVAAPNEDDDNAEDVPSGTVMRTKSPKTGGNEDEDTFHEPNWAEKLQKGADSKSLYANAKLPSGVQKSAKNRTTIAEFKMLYRENKK
eukprot:TRINITY_DN950_c0_g1_i1.p1 TRINITY_DN950_c0_g1~~TRINITY_DN950_c0_g1_i1.p1  ORF type:complete len:359 (-),score=102.41 TRINITY_DN950_c0_g1_i1:226-1302(-)